MCEICSKLTMKSSERRLKIISVIVSKMKFQKGTTQHLALTFLIQAYFR